MLEVATTSVPETQQLTLVLELESALESREEVRIRTQCADRKWDAAID